MTMHVRIGANPLPQRLRGGVIAIGNFDGLHRGHQKLIGLAQQKARELDKPCGILTFEPHPRQFFRPQENFFRLTPRDLKLRLAAALEIDFASVLDFGPELAGLSAEAFVEQEIIASLGAQHVVTGYDFHFGKGRSGNPQSLAELGRQRGFGVSVLDPVREDGSSEPFASSHVRQALTRGDVAEAARHLGYWWRMEGVVARGDQRGRTIGYPTANIELAAGMAAREGIYAARVQLEGRPGFLKGAAYIGKRPTFDTDRSFLEVHLLDFAGDIYGARLSAELVSFIRPDQKFDTLEELLDRMKRDCAEISSQLDALAISDPMIAFPLGKAAAAGKI